MADYLFCLEVPADKRSFTVGEALEATSCLFHPYSVAGAGEEPDELAQYSINRTYAFSDHRHLLMQAVESRTVEIRDPATGMTGPWGWNVESWLLTRADMKAFCDLLAIELVEALPHFVTSARPLEVPAALLALDPAARVVFQDAFPPNYKTNAYTACEYGAEIEARIARQREGFFTLNEAAQVLAEARIGVQPIEAVKRFRLAHSKGVLPIHQANTRFLLEAGEAVSDWRDLLEVSELDAWLRASAGYGFPVAAAVPLPPASASAIETPKQRRARLLQMHDAEVSAGRERGALARITEIEKRTRPTADRSNIGKEIRKAREERAAERRGGTLTRLLG